MLCLLGRDVKTNNIKFKKYKERVLNILKPEKHSSFASLQFLPHDALHRRGLCCGKMSICPSVCLSVCMAHAEYCIEMPKRIIKLFSPSSSHTVLAFPYRTVIVVWIALRSPGILTIIDGTGHDELSQVYSHLSSYHVGSHVPTLS